VFSEDLRIQEEDYISKIIPERPSSKNRAEFNCNSYFNSVEEWNL